MIRIIDKTLVSIDPLLVNSSQITSYCEKIAQVGVKTIELPVALINKIECLPDGINYVLSVNTPHEAAKHTRFNHFVLRHGNYSVDNSFTYEFQVNDIREIHNLRQYSNAEKVRITGLDDLMCHDYSHYMDIIRHTFSGRIELCPQNSHYCATAIATQWILQGNSDVVCSFAGIGGFSAIEEVIMALRINSRYKPNQDLSIFQDIKILFEDMTARFIPENKPIIGSRIFMVEAGVHADGVRKNPLTYEPYDPSIVGAQRSIIVGKHSGKAAITLKLIELGVDTQSLNICDILEHVKEKSILWGKSLSDTELIEIVKEVQYAKAKEIYS